MKLRTLGSTREIGAVLENGRRCVADPFVVYHLTAEDSDPAESRLAIQVPRKVGGAVTRNRIRRLIKEVCRTAFPSFLRNASFVFIARNRAASLGFHEVKALLLGCFEREGFLNQGDKK